MSSQPTSQWNVYSTTSSITRCWSRGIRRSLVLVLALAMLLGVAVRPAQAASPESRVLPQLQQEAAANPNKLFRVIVMRVANNRAADQALGSLGGAKIRDMAIDAFVANLPGQAVAALGRNPAVKFISYDATMIKTAVVDPSKLGTVYPGAANASGLWSSLTGAGVGVAIVDTGINAGRSDWKDAYNNSRIVAKVLFNSALEKTSDGHGHGTHVAGVIGGNSWYRSETALKGKYIGIAPEARLINVRVSDDQGMSYTSDVADAIEWVIANRQIYNIRVMNLSLISSVAESYKTSALAAVVEKAWFNGILVVVSAGNTGANTMYYPPANDPFVITVGAADSMNTVDRGDDGMAPWSSYGITQDGFNKPDVVAPGRNVVSTLASSESTLAKLYPDRIVDSSYLRMSGTSMAAPVVAGVAALAFQAHPEWTNDQVKWLLLNTSTRLGPATSPLPGQGAGQVDATALTRYSSIPGLANQNQTISELLIGPNGATVYISQPISSSANWSTANWSTANWSTANWSTANWSTANWSTANWSAIAEPSQP